MPFRRLKAKARNFAVGDICFLITDTEVGSPGYRLCRIQQVSPDSNGQVRTVKVRLRPRDSRDLFLPHKSKDKPSAARTNH